MFHLVEQPRVTARPPQRDGWCRNDAFGVPVIGKLPDMVASRVPLKKLQKARTVEGRGATSWVWYCGAFAQVSAVAHRIVELCAHLVSTLSRGSLRISLGCTPALNQSPPASPLVTSGQTAAGSIRKWANGFGLYAWSIFLHEVDHAEPCNCDHVHDDHRECIALDVSSEPVGRNRPAESAPSLEAPRKVRLAAFHQRNDWSGKPSLIV